MAPLNIAIIGAGPGGCMLTRLLQTANPSIKVTIFELEASVNYRSQGGTLDLRSDSGLAAIKEANLWDEFQKHARYDGESLLITDKNLTTWMRRNPRKEPSAGKRQMGEAPEIDRKDLRKMLMESLPPSTVRWGYKLSRVEETPSGLTLHFVNGEIFSGYDLIVGCDGAFSKTRALLSSEKPFYAGFGGWALEIPDAAKTAPEVYKLVNRGSVFAYSDAKLLSVQQLTNKSIHIACYGPYPEDYTKTCGFNATDLAEAKRVMAKDLHDWHPEFKTVIDKAQGTVVWRNLYQLPADFSWKHKAGVTLLGDAAHLMTPFAGIGVNTALHDAILLSREIVAAAAGQRGSLDQHIRIYEEKMLAYAHKGMRHTEACIGDMLLKPGAPRTGIESWVLRHAKQDMPQILHPFIAAFIYIGYWLYKWFV